MGADQDEYHVRIDHHTATPAALADAQLALLKQRSTDPRQRASRRWKRRGVLALGLLVVVGILVLVVAAASAGRATAYENCVADAEGMAATFDAAQLAGAVGQAASAEELCAGYRG